MVKRAVKSITVAVKIAFISFKRSFKNNEDMDYILGYRDPITRCFSLKVFEDDKKRIGKNKALVIIDIDDFKEINDKKGHLAGDKVLKRLGNILNQTVNGKGYAYRLHGDEFALVIDQSDVKDICEKVHRNIRKSDEFTISQGVVYNLNNEISEKVIDVADRAMYESKRNGKAQTTMIPAVA